MSARGAVAFAVALVAFLAAGLWLGGHPRSLPEPLRDVFVAEPGGLTAEAAEAIEDNYYRPVGGTELGNASLQGMVRRAAQTPRDDRYSEYFSPEALESFNQQIEGRFSGIGLERDRGEDRGCGWPRSSRARRPKQAGIEAGDTIVSVEGEVDRRRRAAPKRRRRSRARKGPQVTIGVRDAQERQGAAS